MKYVCEVAGCNNKPDRYNETVRDKKTKIAKIMNICTYHFCLITGAK